MKHLRVEDKKKPFNYERRALRFDTVLPVKMGTFDGLARNLSATGIYFETEAAPALGSHVCFAVELTVRGQKLELMCDGKVLRIDYRNGVQGLAAKFDNSFFPNPAEVIEVGAAWPPHTH